MLVVMKKLMLVFTLICISISGCSQSKQNETRDSTLMQIAKSLSEIHDRVSKSDRYKLYPTENIYNFLKLDTATGKIDQVQWSLDSEKEGSVTINDDDLSYETGNGTFELYPTKNIYQFLLLDKVTGRQWHVQWGMENTKRWIIRIY